LNEAVCEVLPVFRRNRTRCHDYGQVAENRWYIKRHWSLVFVAYSLLRFACRADQIIESRDRRVRNQGATLSCHSAENGADVGAMDVRASSCREDCNPNSKRLRRVIILLRFF
jgi:hypothetical protein